MKSIVFHALTLFACALLLACAGSTHTELDLGADGSQTTASNYALFKHGNRFQIKQDGLTYFQTPRDGHFLIGTSMVNGWPNQWAMEEGAISCTLLTDGKPCPEDTDIQISQPLELKTTLHPGANKNLEVREVLSVEHGVVKAVRRWYWAGGGVLNGITLSAHWNVAGAVDAAPSMPGSMLYGNPHEGRSNDANDRIGLNADPGSIPSHLGVSPNDITYLEEHRISSPFVSVEWTDATHVTRGAALHVLPSLVLDTQGNGIGNSIFYRNSFGTQPYDQWWSLGATSHTGISQSSLGEGTVLGLLSGPTAKNKTKGIVNTAGDFDSNGGRGWALNYRTDLSLVPGTTIEKTYFLEAIATTERGWSFTQGLKKAMEIADFKYEPSAYWHGDYRDVAHPALKKLQTLLNYAFDQWTGYGFGWNHGDEVLMGWASQSEIPSYATLGLFDLQSLDWNTIVPNFLHTDQTQSKKSLAFDLASAQINLFAKKTIFFASDGSRIGTIADLPASTKKVSDFDVVFGKDASTGQPVASGGASFLNKSQGIDNIARTIETYQLQAGKSAFQDAGASAQGKVTIADWTSWLSAASTALSNQIQANITSDDGSIVPFWLDTDGWMGYPYAVSPLLRAYRLLPQDSHREQWKDVALQLATAYKERYGDMQRVYWGGTSDCGCEDKEGAWGAAQAFLAARDYYQSQMDAQSADQTTKRNAQALRDSFQKAARHALYVTHSYTYIWNVKMPPGRTLASDFDTRGLTLVSVGHIHIDALGARYADEFRSNAAALGDPALWTAVSKSLLAGALELQDPRFVSADTANTRYSMDGGIAEQFFPSNWCYYCSSRTQPDYPFSWRGEMTKAYGPLWSVAHVLGTFTQMQLSGFDPVRFLETGSDPWDR